MHSGFLKAFSNEAGVCDEYAGVGIDLSFQLRV
jgi:hypothetical protein